MEVILDAIGILMIGLFLLASVIPTKAIKSLGEWEVATLVIWFNRRSKETRSAFLTFLWWPFQKAVIYPTNPQKVRSRKPLTLSTGGLQPVDLTFTDSAYFFQIPRKNVGLVYWNSPAVAVRRVNGRDVEYLPEGNTNNQDAPARPGLRNLFGLLRPPQGLNLRRGRPKATLNGLFVYSFALALNEFTEVEVTDKGGVEKLSQRIQEIFQKQVDELNMGIVITKIQTGDLDTALHTKEAARKRALAEATREATEIEARGEAKAIEMTAEAKANANVLDFEKRMAAMQEHFHVESNRDALVEMAQNGAFQFVAVGEGGQDGLMGALVGSQHIAPVSPETIERINNRKQQNNNEDNSNGSE